MKSTLSVNMILLASLTAVGQSGDQGGNKSQPVNRNDVSAQTATTPAADTNLFAMLVPFKDVFIIREADATGLGFIAECRNGTTHDGRIEMLEGPSFVGLSIVGPGRTAGGHSLAVGIISPFRGDAGTYNVKVSLGSCGGGEERVISFKVKVKKAKGE